VRVLAAVLDRLVITNKNHPTKNITKFSAAKRPAISVLDYLMRIHLYGRCSPSCFVLALVYIDRLIQRDGFVLVGLNVHRVIITSLMIAAKFFDDFYFNNAFYARVGGIGTVEINELEVDFLRRLEYSLHVTTEEFDRYNEELRVHAEVGGSEEEVEYFKNHRAAAHNHPHDQHHQSNDRQNQHQAGSGGDNGIYRVNNPINRGIDTVPTSNTVPPPLIAEAKNKNQNILAQNHHKTHYNINNTYKEIDAPRSNDSSTGDGRSNDSSRQCKGVSSPKPIINQNKGSLKHHSTKSEQGGGYPHDDDAKDIDQEEEGHSYHTSDQSRQLSKSSSPIERMNTRGGEASLGLGSGGSSVGSTGRRSSLRLSWPSTMSAWYAPIASVLPSRVISKT